ncbi:MAG: transcriptional regulator [Micrococcales bacterium]|jgi:hypothetical protein|nr:transcriptional regulator [Micrococcales bacterium]
MMTAVNKGRRITGAEREDLAVKVKGRYTGGESIRDIAAETGRSYGFIHRLLVESETTLRGRGGPTRAKK